MRRILAASLLLIPSLFPAAAVASTPNADSSVPTRVRPISTGVTDPILLKTAEVELPPAGRFDQPTLNDAEFVVELNVDRFGKPQDIQIVDSANPELDQRVIDAVRQFRWRPAMLDTQAIPLDLTLKVKVQF
jgi:protein TonB